MNGTIENTWGVFIRSIGIPVTLHNLAQIVVAPSSHQAERAVKLPAGILDDDHEMVLRQFTVPEWNELQNDGGKLIEENAQ